MEQACACCFEFQHSALEPSNGTADCNALFLSSQLWGTCGPGIEPQSGNTPGLYSINSDHLCRTDGVKYEGLPCCFYEEKQVACSSNSGSAGGGCYTEDYAVNVQYTLPDDTLPSCCKSVYDLGQRIPIIPEDRDCELMLPAECQGTHTGGCSSWDGTPELDTYLHCQGIGEVQDEREVCYEATSFLQQTYSREEEARMLFPSPALNSQKLMMTTKATGNTCAFFDCLQPLCPSMWSAASFLGTCSHKGYCHPLHNSRLLTNPSAKSGFSCIHLVIARGTEHDSLLSNPVRVFIHIRCGEEKT